MFRFWLFTRVLISPPVRSLVGFPAKKHQNNKCRAKHHLTSADGLELPSESLITAPASSIMVRGTGHDVKRRSP